MREKGMISDATSANRFALSPYLTQLLFHYEGISSVPTISSETYETYETYGRTSINSSDFKIHEMQLRIHLV